VLHGRDQPQHGHRARLPAPAWKQGSGGRPPGRDIVDAIGCLVKEGICWRAMPPGFPPWQTVCAVLDRWQDCGATEAMHGELRRQCRIAAGRTPEPSAAVTGSQPVTAAETVARDSRGFDAGKKINGRKRRIAAGTIGLLLTVLITAAGSQDRDAAKPLRGTCAALSLRSSSAGPMVATAASSSPGPGKPSSSPSRSSGAPMTCTPSKCCPAGGSSGGP
jgi:transposase